jgi:hypothetical protein
MTPNSQTTLNNLENDIVNFLVDKLENSEVSLQRASLIAKFVLVHLPENTTDEELKQLLPSLDDTFIELAGIVHKYMNKYEEIEKTEVTGDVQSLIKSGKFDEASRLMKDYFKKTVQS